MAIARATDPGKKQGGGGGKASALPAQGKGGPQSAQSKPAEKSPKPPASTGSGKEVARSPQPDAEKQGPGAKPPVQQAKPGGKSETKPGGSTAPQKDTGDNNKGKENFQRMAVQPKLTVSEPGDAHEQEAEQVAARVMRMPASSEQDSKSKVPAQPGGPAAKPPGGGGEAPAATGKTTPDAKGKPALPAAAGPAKGGSTPAPGKAAAGNKPSGASTQGEKKPEPVSVTRAPQTAPATNKPSVPSDFAKDLGPGQALDPNTRSFFEQRFGHDLGEIRIHTDDKADQAAKQIKARAFTFSSHIAFAKGEYQPETDYGKQLLAHEITHALQQQADTVPRAVMRANKGDGAGTAAGGKIDSDIPLDIPRNKGRHIYKYMAYASSSKLERKANYNRKEEGPNQVKNWMNGIKIDKAKLEGNADIKAQLDAAAGPKLKLKFADGEEALSPTNLPDLITLLKRPNWDKKGKKEVEMQVDHVVELQLGGEDGMSNYELLDQPHNGSVGSSFDAAIKRNVRQYILNHKNDDAIKNWDGDKDASGLPKLEKFLEKYAVVFHNVSPRGSDTGRKEKDTGFWTKEEIEALEHITKFLPDKKGANKGDEKNFALFSPSGALMLARISHGEGELSFSVGGTAKNAIAGIELKSASLNSGYNNAGNGKIGSLECEWHLPPDFNIEDKKLTLNLLKVSADHSGKLDQSGLASLIIPSNFKYTSPVEFSGISMDANGIVGKGTMRPSLPLLSGVEVPMPLEGGVPKLSYVFDTSKLTANAKVPGLSIDESSLGIFYDADGFGVEGGLGFSVKGLGQGELMGRVGEGKTLEVEGRFDVDQRLFDQASMKVWYRKDGFGGEGELAITNPDKIKGIKSARVKAGYAANVFTADGGVQPDIPGMDNVGLKVTYGADALVISGDLDLKSGVPGLQGGKVHVDVTDKGAGYKVAASGAITPNIPGITGKFSASYDEGAFTVGGEVGFQAGVVSGTVSAGATNRALDAEGKPSGAGQGTELKAFGSGTVTAKLTDWMQGSVGFKMKPDGTVLINGKIAVPQSLEVFKQHPDPAWKKTLVPIPKVSIPIVGVAFGGQTVGIAASISGSVDATGYIGPGKLTKAEVGIEDFNPKDPDSLRVKGDAKLDVPAYAGLGASVDAGIAVGVPVISATGGLKLGAELGVQGNGSATAKIDYTPKDGVKLATNVKANASPKLKFTVVGFVKVEADVAVTTFNLYRKDWKLGAFEYGPALTVGVNLPLNYSSKDGIDFDFNKVEFQKPSITMEEIIQGVLRDNGSERMKKH